MKTPQNTATYYGWSYFERLLRCQEEAELTRALWRNNDGGGPPTATGGLGPQSGTGYHRFQERYHTGGDPAFDTADVDLSDLTPEAQKRAVKAFGRYRSTFKPNAWGQGVEAEVSHEGNVHGMLASIRPDLVVRVQSRSVRRIIIGNKVTGITAGHWLIDWKLYDTFRPDTFIHAVRGMRSLWYRCVWNALEPKKRCKGLIVHVQEFSTGKFRPIVVGPVRESEQDRFEAAIARINETRHAAIKTNPAACAEWNRTCEFLGAECSGY